MREVTTGRDGIKVDRPLKTAEVCIRGLEWSITVIEVVDAIAEQTRCQREDIKTGDIRRSPQSLGSLWLKMPLAAAQDLCRENRLQMGWFNVAVELLDVRPLRCHKCLERGHVWNMCPVSADRSRRCYRCGGTGHTAKVCREQIRCPLCSDLGRPSGHVLGAPECAPQKRRGKLAEGGQKGPVKNPPPTAIDQAGRLGPTRRGKTGRRIYHPLPLGLPRLNNIRRRRYRGLNARYGPLGKLKKGGKTLRTIPALVGIRKWNVQPNSLQLKNGSQADTI